MSEALVGQAGETRLARLESVRAVAALGVLVGHALIFGRIAAGEPIEGRLDEVLLGGGLGVFLFFALTGYLLYLPFARRDFGSGPAIDLRRYARNRVLRILPLYYAVLVVVLLLQEDGGTGRQWTRFGLFLQNFSRDTVGTVDGPMWSLVVELHFYALLPLGAAVLGRLARGRVAVATGALAVLGGLSLALHFAKVEAVAPAPVDLRWAYSLPTTLGFFVAGMLVALVRARLDATGRAGLAGGLLGVGDVWIVASIPLWLAVAFDYQRLALCAPAAALVVGGCVLTSGRGPLLRLLEWRPLALVGIASYSLYLVHFPVIDALSSDTGSVAELGLLGGALSGVLAFVGYRFVEAPFLRLRRRWA